MTKSADHNVQEMLNRRYQEFVNRLPAATPVERDEIGQEMADILRQLRELSARNSKSRTVEEGAQD